MREAVKSALLADAPLTALLPGGIYAGGEITRQETPGAFDANGEIKPCALVALETITPTGPYPNSSRQFFTLNFYQFAGYAAIDAALARAFALLNRSKTGGPGVWEIQHVEDSGDLEDPGLLCSLRYSRWAAYQRHP